MITPAISRILDGGKLCDLRPLLSEACRQVIDRLLENGTGTASSLSDGLAVTRQTVSKHLVVLERAGLVNSTAVGRERIYQPDEAQLARAAAATRRRRVELGRTTPSHRPNRPGHRASETAQLNAKTALQETEDAT